MKASVVMRTTLNIDDPVLEELKSLSKTEGKSLGRLASDLLLASLSERRRRAEAGDEGGREIQWISRPMGTRVDLDDKDAVFAAMESGEEGR